MDIRREVSRDMSKLQTDIRRPANPEDGIEVVLAKPIVEGVGLLADGIDHINSAFLSPVGEVVEEGVHQVPKGLLTAGNFSMKCVLDGMTVVGDGIEAGTAAILRPVGHGVAQV